VQAEGKDYAHFAVDIKRSMQNVKSKTAKPRVRSVKLFKWAMSLGKARHIKFRDAQLQNAAEDTFLPMKKM
jgi:hypothetical protein